MVILISPFYYFFTPFFDSCFSLIHVISQQVSLLSDTSWLQQTNATARTYTDHVLVPLCANLISLLAQR